MKKLIYISGILSLLSGCDILNVESTDSIPASAAFKDKAGIERGIVGSYSSLQSLSYYGRSYTIFSDLASDNLIHPPDATSSDYAEVDNNVILPENAAVGGIWASIYSGINVANNVITKVPDMTDMTDTEKNEALGELYFLRALNHFNLLNYFGSIPIKNKPTVDVDNLNAARNPVDQVYKQIIDDLTFAELHLKKSTSVKIRATKYAATALLARVYLYQGNFNKAYEKADEVIINGGYTLPAKYADVFAADGSAETIFEVDFTETDKNRIAEYNFPKTLNGRREVAPSESLINAYETDDERDTVSIKYNGINAYANKYTDLNKGTDNVIVLRLAEMYLIRAEAEARKTNGNLGTITDDINVIRSRANLPGTTASNINELLSAIEKERRVEFAFEGQRWFDLVRTKRTIDVVPTVKKTEQNLFPIPLAELNTNDSPEMNQNPGYN